MSLSQDIQDFLDYCQLTKQYTEHTVRNYQNTLDRFLAFCEQKKIQRTQEIDINIINNYRKFLNKKKAFNKKKSLKTQAYQIVVIRSFLKFLIQRGQVVLSPEKLDLPKSRMRRIDFLTDQEIGRLLKEIINDKKKIPEVQKLRNQSIILTLFSSGLRLSELLKLTKSDILKAVYLNQENQSKNIFPLQIQGKGGKVRTTFLSPTAYQAIQIYLDARGEDEIPFLFISFSKNRPSDPTKIKPLSPRMVQMMLQEYAFRVGIFKQVTPHTLRHSFATKVLSKTGDLRSLQELLGHSSISTTQIYTHVTDWQIRDIHSKAFNENEIGGKNKTEIKSKKTGKKTSN